MNLDRAFQEIASLLGMDDDFGTVQAVREVLDLFAYSLNDDLPVIGDLHTSIPYKAVDGSELTVDVAVPKGEGPFPVLVYLHGGAWIWGSPRTHRKLTCRLAEHGFLTISVDYRLAPEHRFPAAFHDCVHAIHFTYSNAERWGGDPERLVLAGDSAGANLAAAAAIELANTSGAPTVKAVGLIYGVFEFASFTADSVTSLLVDAYLGSDSHHLVTDPRVSPLVKAASLPPAHIAVGSADELIADSEALRSKLARAGKVHDYHVYEDMPHAFMQMEFLPDARRSIQRMADFLHDAVTET